MSLIGDAQEFLYYQKPQGTNTQFPPRGGVRNVSASYITGRKMPSRPEQDVSQQYTTLKEAREAREAREGERAAREGERAAGILNTPALTSPLNKMIQEPSDVEQARGYLGMAQTGVNALEGITKISDATLGTDLAKSAFGSALKNVGGGLGAVNAGLSAYNIAQGRGTAKDYAMLGKTSLEAASKVAGKYGGTMISSALGLAGKLAGAAGSAYNITRGKGTPGNYVSAGGAISSAIGSATGSALASAIGTAVSSYAAPAMLAREGLGALLRSIDHPVTRIQGELMQEPTFEGLAGAVAKKLYKGVFNPGARLEEYIDRVHRGFDPVGGILTGRIFDRRAITDIVSILRSNSISALNLIPDHSLG